MPSRELTAARSLRSEFLDRPRRVTVRFAGGLRTKSLVLTRGGGGMIQHEFQTTVARSPEEVFDFLVDLRNAPQWEPNCQQVEKTSDGPIGRGTTFRAKKGMGRLESEIVEFERPTHFATRDKGRGITCGLDFRCDGKNGG